MEFYIIDILCIISTDEESMNSLKRKFSGENLKWSEDRENYDQSQTRHENLRKRQSKLRSKYVKTTS